jgi:hypothetical protein
MVSMVPHFSDFYLWPLRNRDRPPLRTTDLDGNRLKDGGKVVSITRRLPLTPHLLGRLQGHSAAGRIRLIKKSHYLIGNRPRDLPPCSRVPGTLWAGGWVDPRRSLDVAEICRLLMHEKTKKIVKGGKRWIKKESRGGGHHEK